MKKKSIPLKKSNKVKHILLALGLFLAVILALSFIYPKANPESDSVIHTGIKTVTDTNIDNYTVVSPANTLNVQSLPQPQLPQLPFFQNISTTPQMPELNAIPSPFDNPNSLRGMSLSQQTEFLNSLNSVPPTFSLNENPFNGPNFGQLSNSLNP